jgi:hypothetical protein
MNQLVNWKFSWQLHVDFWASMMEDNLEPHYNIYGRKVSIKFYYKKIFQ